MKRGNTDYSDEHAYRIAYLIAGYIRKTLTETEHDELDAWVEASDDNMHLFESLTDETNIEANLAWMDRVQTEKALRQAKSKIGFRTGTKVNRSMNWWPYIVAASLVIALTATLMLTGDYFYPETPPPAASAEDFPPGANRATLTLGNGRVVDLQNAASGSLLKEYGTTATKITDGELSYSSGPAHPGTEHHLLRTPRGGQYSLVLADGSKVWLNAESSLRFPTCFIDSQRVVELQGEAYFEVAKGKKPFLVLLSSGETITVLGTRFNVMAYADEKEKAITLEEGVVEITAADRKLQLNPGQQAAVAGGKMQLHDGVDVEEITAWKNGYFVFRDDDIHAIMKQVRRWYDVNIVFSKASSEHFNATISRNESLSKLLHYLELTGKIHFKIKNRTIHVLP